MDNRKALSIISKRLQPKETIVWVGVPSPWLATTEHVPLLSVMTFWAAISYLFALAMFAPEFIHLEMENAEGLLPQIFIVLSCVGSTIGAAIFLRRILGGWQTAYAVTSRRCLIAVGEDGPVHSFSSDALSVIHRTGNACKGTLLFGRPRRTEDDPRVHGFYGIPLPERVEALIYDTLIQPTRHQRGAAA